MGGGQALVLVVCGGLVWVVCASCTGDGQGEGKKVHSQGVSAERALTDGGRVGSWERPKGSGGCGAKGGRSAHRRNSEQVGGSFLPCVVTVLDSECTATPFEHRPPDYSDCLVLSQQKEALCDALVFAFLVPCSGLTSLAQVRQMACSVARQKAGCASFCKEAP